MANVHVHVYGAGSIGNHLTHACRSQGWSVSVIDTDPAALDRMKTSIYPSRYGQWDESIRLSTSPAGLPAADLVIVGTPPDSHLKIAFDVLQNRPPRILCVEKPFCTPDLSECDRFTALTAEKGTLVLTGYNHTLVPATVAAAEKIRSDLLGPLQTLVAEFREYWGGIFAAHPWLSGPADSYLGFWKRGGGAGGEHSHAINIWQFFALTAGAGRITEVHALLDYVNDRGCAYDRICQLHVRTEKGLAGSIVQDVVTEPARKWARLQGENGHIEWHINHLKDEDRIFFGPRRAAPDHLSFPKTRPGDFKPEIEHIGRLLDGTTDPASSPIHLHRGLETMLVIAAAHRSAATQRAVHIDYSRGWTENALVQA
jgi:predicted dehydrogenase